MKKLLLILLLLPALIRAQQVDTVIQNEVYTSYYSYQLHEPLYVVYKLYQGGGSCSRAAFKFITGNLLHSATAQDYAHNGYDEGHLANAADFAFDCKKEELTFRFYNCVPQTPKLNRGIWKTWETTIRKESLTDSLMVYCGSIFGDKIIGPGKIGVPNYCWKIVQSLTSGQIIHCLIFPNDSSDTCQTIKLEDLQKLLDCPIKIK